jgi:polysaccharide biosynthesis/export protein
MKNIYLLLVILIVSSSCSKRNLRYFSDIDTQKEYKVPINAATQPKIQEDDLLSITVTSLNAESNMLFNAGVLAPSSQSSNVFISNPINENYLVDKNGFINYPVVGQVNLRGLTKLEAIEKMTKLLEDYVQDPIVNIRFMNFKITVIGEVQKPDTFVIPTEKVTVLEALGLAGDMTAYGRRDNVLIIREKDGVRTSSRINLNTTEILSSPYYYLHQNDIVYVEPFKTKAIQADSNPQLFAVISMVSSLVIILFFNVMR